MGNVVKTYVFNSKDHMQRNTHKYKISKFNLEQTLKDLEFVNVDKRRQMIALLETIEGSADLDTNSFNKMLYNNLNDIKIMVNKEIEEANAVNRVVDSLIKHFNLWGN